MAFGIDDEVIYAAMCIGEYHYSLNWSKKNCGCYFLKYSRLVGRIFRTVLY